MDVIIYIAVGIIIGIVIRSVFIGLEGDKQSYERPPKQKDNDFLERFLNRAHDQGDSSKNENYYDYDVSYGPRRYSREEYNYWSNATKYICDYSMDGEYDLVYRLVVNILEDKDNKAYAYELYRLIDTAIYYLYPLREEGNCKEEIFDLAFRGLTLIDDYIEQSEGYLTWRYPTKLVIMLEKERRIEEAIELCDFFTSRGVRDTGYENFEARKRKLQRKLPCGSGKEMVG